MSVARVRRHERTNIAVSTSVTVTTLPMAVERMSLKASRTPDTSLFSRLTSAPVRARVKNASDIAWMWENTRVRRSSTISSPILAAIWRCQNVSPESTTATPAAIRASWTTRCALPSRIPLLIRSRKMSGFTTPAAASSTTSPRKKERIPA